VAVFLQPGGRLQVGWPDALMAQTGLTMETNILLTNIPTTK
jgi:hypothetical protein